MELIQKCKYCGREFPNLKGNKEFCTKQCAQASFWRENPDYQKEWRRSKKEVLSVVCKECGGVFDTTNGQRKFCSDKCKVSFHNAHRTTTREDLRICPICEASFRPMQKTGVGRTYCSTRCRNKEMNSRRKAASDRKSWRQAKAKWCGNWIMALERDSFTCQICGRKRTPGQRVRDMRFILEVHHRDGSGETGGKNHNLDNLMTLCAECHREFHTKINLIFVDGEYFIKGKIFNMLGIDSVKTIS